MTTLTHARWSPLSMTKSLGRELLPFAVGIAVWQLLSSLNIWPPVLFPSPLQVFHAFVADLRSGALLTSLGVSLKSLGLGFLVGALIAVPLGYLMGLNRASRDFFDPLVNVMSVFFPVLHNLLTGIRTVQPVLVEAVQTLGARRMDVIAHVIFPATLPNLMTGVRLGIAFGFRSLVGGEMIASTDGIGYAIFNAQQYFQSARIVVGMLAIGITWLLMDRFILRPIEQRTTMRWGLMRDGLDNT